MLSLHELYFGKPSKDMFAAILFHDAIYVPGRDDNEDQSACAARACLKDKNGLHERVTNLIMSTTIENHTTDLMHCAGGAIIRDLDLARLSAPREEFLQHQRNILKENMGLFGYEEHTDWFKEFLERRDYKLYRTEEFSIFNPIAVANIEAYIRLWRL